MVRTLAAEKDIAHAAASLLAVAVGNGGRIAIGFSGGVDSSLLLATCARNLQSSFELNAIHVNHGLQPQANDWEKHCSAFAEQLGTSFSAVRVNIKPGAGAEARARAARLRAFANSDADAIMLAHHADDQAETVMLKVMRGAGTRGLASLRAVRTLPGGSMPVVRPLLAFTRNQILAAARKMKLAWVEDPSNAQLDANRNWLRSQVLPQAAKRFPGAAAALVSTAANAAETASLLDEIAQADDDACRDSRGRLRRAQLAKLDEAHLKNWLQWNIARRGLEQPSARHLAQAAQQLAAGTNAHHKFGKIALETHGSLVNWSDSKPAAFTRSKPSHLQLPGDNHRKVLDQTDA